MAGLIHLTPAELFVYGHATIDDGPWEGDVEAPTGAFRGVYLSDNDRHVLKVIEGSSTEPVPWWLVVEDSDGNVSFRWFDDENEYDDVCTGLLQMFAEWHDNDDEPSNDAPVVEQLITVEDGGRIVLNVPMPHNYETALKLWRAGGGRARNHLVVIHESLRQRDRMTSQFTLRSTHEWGNVVDGTDAPVELVLEMRYLGHDGGPRQSYLIDRLIKG